MLAAVLILSLALIGIWHWYFSARFIESTDNAYVEAKIAVISARVSGYVDDIRVMENQRVRRGDLLFIIDQADYKARVESAFAQVTAVEARAYTLQQKLKLQQSLIVQAKAELEIADAELNRLKKDLQRYTRLNALSASSRQQLELVQAEELKSLAAKHAAKARLDAQRKQMSVWSAQIEELDAELVQANALLNLARNSLNDTLVLAPFDGVIGNKHLELGQFLQSGTPVLNIVSLDDIYVTANFKETQIEHMQAGNAVSIRVDAYPGQILNAKVVSISPASGARFSLLPPENATGNFSKIVQRIPVRIELTDTTELKGTLRPGFSVVVDVDTRGANRSTSQPGKTS